MGVVATAVGNKLDTDFKYSCVRVVYAACSRECTCVVYCKPKCFTKYPNQITVDGGQGHHDTMIHLCAPHGHAK
jgi:predicted transcriptional regulator